MALFFWQKGKLVEAFARTLADDVSSVMRPEAVTEYLTLSANMHTSTQKNPAKKSKKTISGAVAVEQQLDDAVKRVNQFKQEHSLGVYRKARLHQLFTDRLTELGFPPELANDLNRVILMQTP